GNTDSQSKHPHHLVRASGHETSGGQHERNVGGFMSRIMKYVSAAMALTLALTMTAFAQTSGTTTPAQDNYVTEKSFKSKVFDVKYRDPNSLATVLSKLGSGFKGATISPSTEFKTLTVRDFPENLVTIEEALKRLDTPTAPRPNIDLHMYV